MVSFLYGLIQNLKGSLMDHIPMSVEAERFPDGSVEARLEENGVLIARHRFAALNAVAWSDAEAMDRACDWATDILFDRYPETSHEDTRADLRRILSVKQEM